MSEGKRLHSVSRYLLSATCGPGPGSPDLQNLHLDMVQGGNLQSLNLETGVKVESKGFPDPISTVYVEVEASPGRADSACQGTEQEACLLTV